jgi:hypothetical protein
MAATDRIKEALTTFLASDQPGVLAIKGAWGVGKTYFWKRFIAEAKPAKSCRAYSYVSLFGISTLPELRRAIFTRQTPFAGSGGKLEATKKYAAAVLRNVEISVGPLKGTEAWADVVEDKSLREYVVCIDDLERKERDLSPSALLGFIVGLRDERNCKVVLLYNDDEVVKNKNLAKTLAEYREKVIDRELTFKPTVSDSYRIIFHGAKYDFKAARKSRPDPFNPSDDRGLQEIFESIGTANIRVMRKAYDALEYFSDGMRPYPRQWPAFARQVVKACCLHYVYGRDFLIEDALQQNRWLRAYMRKNDDAAKNEPDKYAPVLKIGYLPGETDGLILEYLRFGFVDWHEHKAALVNRERQLALTQLSAKLNSIWDKIWDNFQADQGEFNAAMGAFLIKHQKYLGLSEVSQAINILQEFDGSTPELEQLLKDKVDEFVDTVKETHLADLHFHAMNQNVINMVREKLDAQVVTKSIPDVIKMMTHEDSWNPNDLRYIKGSTTDDFYHYLKSSKEDRLFSRLKRLRERLGDDKYAAGIKASLEEALTKLAKESAINARRIRYGVGFIVPEEKAK